MLRGSITCLILVLLGFPALAQEAAPVTVRFGWPADGRVSVVEKVLKKGNEAVLAYDLVIRAHSDGGRVISYNNLGFRSINGQDATTPEMRAAMASALAAQKAVPDLRIDAKGNFVEFTDFDKKLDEMAEFFVRFGRQNRHEAQKLQRMFKTPQFRQVVAVKLPEIWAVWVGAWVGSEMEVGDRFHGQIELPLWGGPRKIPAQVELECQNRVKHRGKDCLQLRMIQTLNMEGKDFESAMQTLINRGKPPALPGRLPEFDICGNVRKPPECEPRKAHITGGFR